jgi:hypothetical protein
MTPDIDVKDIEEYDVAKYENRREFWDEDTEDSETH